MNSTSLKEVQLGFKGGKGSSITHLSVVRRLQRNMIPRVLVDPGTFK